MYSMLVTRAKVLSPGFYYFPTHSKKMGIETERFVESTLDKDLVICPVCRDVLENPVELPACQHVFCTICLRRWFDTGVKDCPLDRIPVVEKVVSPNRTLKVVLERLRARCEFAHLGCEAVCPVAQLKEHQRGCAYNPRPGFRSHSRDGTPSDFSSTDAPAGGRSRGGGGASRGYGGATGGGQQQQQQEENTGFWIVVFGVVIFVLFNLLRR